LRLIWDPNGNYYGSREYSEILDEIQSRRRNGNLDRHVRAMAVVSGSRGRLLIVFGRHKLWLPFRQQETVPKFEAGVLQAISDDISSNSLLTRLVSVAALLRRSHPHLTLFPGQVQRRKWTFLMLELRKEFQLKWNTIDT
jgi:hypothetical protein